MTARRWSTWLLPILFLPLLVLLSLAIIVRASAPPAHAAATYTGQAFDTCAAPSASTMQAWLSSPYRGIGIYIGGANRACGDGNLSSGWVNAVSGQGWKLAPLYVGLQAPCVNQGGLATLSRDPGTASGQGSQAADDAAHRASNFGLGAGTPIYFDMEAYNSGDGGCVNATLAFEDAWTNELHRLGLVSGVYGSLASTINNLAAHNPNSPDDIWYAAWNNNASVETCCVLPGAYVNHQRIHQYHGDTVQNFGGVSLDIDLDFADGALTGGNCESFSSPATGTHLVCGAILQKYLALGGAYFLGFPTTDETATPDGIGRYNYFSNHGAIYWTPFRGAWSIHGAILDKWAGTGWEAGYLGYPVTDENTTPDGIGRYNYFHKNGAIYWTPGTGAQAIHGAILDKWASFGWENSFLGYPTTDEGTTPNKIGRFNYFSRHGAIYWTGPTGAWSIHGDILDKWAGIGWENSFLGFPTTDENTTPNGIGRYNYFRGHGAIYWTSPTGPWSIHGAILDKWASLGWENSFLGFPVTDETGTPDGIGRFNHFSSNANPANVDGSIYWTPSTNAWSVHGAIRSKWASMGWERSCLHYPVSDEFAITGGRQSNFQSGNIAFSFSKAQATPSC